MKYRALIPVKKLNEAKSRLAKHLTLYQRKNLVLAMLQHVVSTLLDSNIFERVTVVSPDALVLERAQEWGAFALVEEATGHNPSLKAAARRDIAAGTQALLTISADLPLLQTKDIHALITQSTQYQIVLASSEDGTGTNAILMRPPLSMPYLFGPDSLEHYYEGARQHNLAVTIYNSIGLALDIDTIDDLHELEVLDGQWRRNATLATQNL